MRSVDPVRSHIMRSVRRTKTAPEMIVRRALHAEGFRYRANLAALPGSPDIAFTARRKAIFVHGCFWHRHENCKLASTPKTRVDFWTKKFASNTERDSRKVHELLEAGWDVTTVWQCETRNPSQLMHRLRAFIGQPLAPNTKCRRVKHAGAPSLPTQRYARAPK